MLKYLIILFYLINKINSWNWDNYPSPREYNYWKCNVNKETYVCDPDKMLNDEQRKEIVELVENFKEKTKRPNSRNKCMKEGLRLVVALAEDKITEIRSPDTTELCYNVRKWIPNGGCESYVFGIELNKEGFRYCYFMFSPSALYEEDYKNFNRTLPNSKNKCLKEGLRLIVALAENKIEDDGNTTYFCKRNSWSSNNCSWSENGIVLTKDGFLYCYYGSGFFNPHNYDEYLNDLLIWNYSNYYFINFWFRIINSIL
ncbi:hypothetical protein Mgra_00005626 [Meloidogyne graminicola]|uniref:Uncharacterized protein n=1 Tax=Meloidogyne graminicola TaxID=189291 RepID=A0A8S9ZPF5_9BILA|nr:hypothetical protein Mgra_00005626 [Meloidogyne graminicola]